tara:strand:- start:328 stop:474 length:147 start_codon:yes stop_codon:yes gene_type:complete
MIELIIQMLKIGEFEGESELIDIAKGKYKLTTNLKEKAKQIKRGKAWR